MYRSLLIALLLLSVRATAQDGLFLTEKTVARHGVVLGVNGDLDFPGGDMAKRFGTSYRAGIQVLYKTKSNWMLGPKFDYMFGTGLREDSLLINITDKYGSYINSDGQRIGLLLYQRGYMIGMQGGRIFNLSKGNADDGILAMTTVGFMEHKVLIRDRDNTIPSVRGAYKKGYDRLTNGVFVEQYLGYVHFAKNNLFNLHAGLNVAAGFTKGRRDYLFDVMRPDNAARIDLLMGIRIGWYIPIFKRKSEEIYFE